MCYISAMLKRLAILAVVIPLAMASAVYGQVASKPGKASNEITHATSPQTESQKKDQNSQKTPIVVEQASPQQPNPAEPSEEKETEKKLAVYTLWLAIFTGVLVLVSAGQGYFLFMQASHLHTHAGHLQDLASAADANSQTTKATLLEIQRQANQMERQNKILEDSVAAAQKSADAAKISADIAATLSVPVLVVHELETGNVGAANSEAFFQSPKIKITIKNYGQTPAFLKWWSLCFSCEDLPDIPIYDGPGIGMILDKVVVQPGEVYTLPELFYPHRQEFTVESAAAIVNREKPFHVYGYVCYGDLLGNPLRRLKFCETVLNIFGGEVICDWWEGLAPPAYTGTEQFPFKKQAQHNPENANSDTARVPAD